GGWVAAVFLFVVFSIAAGGEQRQEYTRNFQKTVSWQRGQGVRIDHRNGDITVRTHGLSDVRIDASIRVSAPDKEEATRFGEQIQIQVEEGAASVSIRTSYPERRADSYFSRNNISYSVNYEILMPESSPLQILNRFGNVSVSNLKTNADINNAHGRLTFRDGRGSQRLENSFGGVEVIGNAGDVDVTNGNNYVNVTQVDGSLNLRNRFGNVKVVRVSKIATIVNSNGGVELTGAGGPSSVSNSFGSVAVGDISGDLTVRNTNGAVEAHNITGDAELNTTFSSITFTDIGKKLTSTASHSSVTGSKIGQTALIRTSYGAVDVRTVGGLTDIQNTTGKILARDIRG